MLYGGLALYCALGVVHLPVSVQTAIEPYFWLFGPPANLVHGTNFLLPLLAFSLGTVMIGGWVFGILRSRSRLVKGTCSAGLVITWAAFGFIAYAPGA
jgi:hypothetical protein